MRSVLAIAGIAVRNAIRSRVVVCLLVILTLILFGLPLAVKGDGTMVGRVQVMLNYTLGLAAMVLSLTSLWAGCAAISGEIAEKQIHLVVTKPVHRLQIWLGQWLGLMFVNVVLLAFCGIASYGSLQWTLGRTPMADEDEAALYRDILTARRTVNPAPIDVAAAAQAMMDEYRKHNELPAGVRPEKILQAFQRNALIQASTVKPGAALQWEFEIPAEGSARSCVAQYRLSASRMGTMPITGVWKAGTPDHPDAAQQVTTNLPGTVQTLELPSAFAERGGRLVVEYSNADASGTSVIFMPGDAPVLLVTTDRFVWNFARALIVVLSHLAFLTAVGVTAGALFSMPVAGFLSLCLIVLMQLSAYIGSISEDEVIVPWHLGHGHAHGQEHGQGPTWADAAFRLLFQVVHAVIAPLEARDPLGAMASGRLVSWLWVGDAVLVQVVVYGSALALLGTLVLRRREIGLPE